MSRDRFATQSLGVLHGNIKKSRVLLVGAGGIGCELLKNLVLTGFGEIHIIDLDTIDLSNLNRQFLFRREHIKKPKAHVAKESAGKFNPHVKLEAHHANIKDPEFSLTWFKNFNVVFNALDNLDARRHVNRMCLMANVPLIESGTTGFDGQVQVIKKGETECYDCNPKPTPKSFPVCTIRSTPSQPIHCIVWAKSYLFNELFGASEDDPVLDESADSENAEELKTLKEEAKALKTIRESIASPEIDRLVFEKVFYKDIIRLRGMEDMWKTRKPPEPLSLSSIQEDPLSKDSSVAQQDQKVWRISESYAVFSDSIRRLSKRSTALAKDEAANGSYSELSFDKDDEDTLDFVAAAANLRSVVFGIPVKSKFDIKQMAGNIIPAIATTNAMTAGLCVLQAFKVLRDQLPKAKTVFLERSTARILNTESIRPPNPDCAVCATAQSDLVIDPERATLKDLVGDVLKMKLGYGDELSIRSDSGLLYDPDFEDNLSKKFTDLGIKGDSFLTVMDEEDDPRIDLSFVVTERSLPADSGPLLIPQTPKLGKKPKPSSTPTTLTNGDSHSGQEGGAQTNGTGLKRKRSAEELQSQPLKKGKTKEAIEVEDVGNGEIVIDDD